MHLSFPPHTLHVVVTGIHVMLVYLVLSINKLHRLPAIFCNVYEYCLMKCEHTNCAESFGTLYQIISLSLVSSLLQTLYNLAAPPHRYVIP
jgi:hypothetical protein